MKYGYILLLTIVLLPQCRVSDNKKIEEMWTEVKVNSIKKGEQGRRITSLLWDIRDAPEALISSASVWSKRLINSADTDKQLDSLSFDHLRRANDSLDIFMPKVFNWLMSNRDSLERTMYFSFQEDYFKEVRSVDSAKSHFNQIARREKSLYLFY